MVNTLLEKGLALLAITLTAAAAIILVFAENLLLRAVVIGVVVAVGISAALAALTLQAKLLGGTTQLSDGRLFAAVSVFIISLCTHGALLGAFMACARAHGIILDMAPGVAAFSTVIFVMSLPISIGGWGVREVAMVTLLVPLGIDPVSAAATGITAGIVGMAVLGVIALVSLLIWGAQGTP
jgi:uncharacterized membrane protein YbhN (UPF0104 family)